MMLFAFFLVFLGVALILWGILRPAPTTEIPEIKSNKNTRKKNIPPRKEKQIRTIQKKLFNKKYPERNLLPEEERAILKEREISGYKSLKSTESQVRENLPLESDLEERESEPLVNFISDEQPEKKVYYSIEGLLYVDFSRQIPEADKNIKDIEWEESDFTHFRRLGPAKLFQKGNTFEFLQSSLLYSITLEEIERIIFFNKVFCILPSPKDIPHLFFFSPDLEVVKEGISSEYKRL